MKVFLAGGTGVVGRPALAALVADGHDVTAVARGPEKAAQVEGAGATPVTVDLFDRPALEAAVAGHEVVINLATAIPPFARASSKKAWALNDRIRSEASRNLVDGALATGASRYVQESICFPYVDAGDRWIDEDSPTDHAPWGFVAAAEAERQAARFTEVSDGGAGIVLRFAMFHAPEASHTAPMRRALRCRVNPFVGDPDGYVSTIHGDDAGSAVAAVLRAPAGTYNVVDDEPLTRREAGRAAAAAIGVGPPLSFPRWLWRASPPSVTFISRSQRISHDRLTEATGWTPAHPSIRGDWP